MRASPKGCRRMIYSQWKDKGRCLLSVSSHILFLSNLNSIRKGPILMSLTVLLMVIKVLELMPLEMLKRTRSKTKSLVELPKIFQIRRNHLRVMNHRIPRKVLRSISNSSTIISLLKLLHRGFTKTNQSMTLASMKIFT